MKLLSLYRLSRKFRVTYNNTDHNGVFKVWTPQGVVEFKPTEKGLHVLDLKENPEAMYLLVNDADLAYSSQIQTV